MAQTETKSANMPALTPYLVVENAANAIDFYEKAFGFSLVDKMEEAGNITHVYMTRGEAGIMFAPEGMWDNPAKTPAHMQQPAPASFYVYCEDVNALHETAVASGAQSMQAPEDMFWGDRMCALVDNNGYVWNFAQKIS